MRTSPRDSPSTVIPPFVPETSSVPEVAATVNSRTWQTPARSRPQRSWLHQSSLLCCALSRAGPAPAPAATDAQASASAGVLITNLFIAFTSDPLTESSGGGVGRPKQDSLAVRQPWGQTRSHPVRRRSDSEPAEPVPVRFSHFRAWAPLVPLCSRACGGRSSATAARSCPASSTSWSRAGEAFACCRALVERSARRGHGAHRGQRACAVSPAFAARLAAAPWSWRGGPNERRAVDDLRRFVPDVAWTPVAFEWRPAAMLAALPDGQPAAVRSTADGQARPPADPPTRRVPGTARRGAHRLLPQIRAAAGQPALRAGGDVEPQQSARHRPERGRRPVRHPGRPDYPRHAGAADCAARLSSSPFSNARRRAASTWTPGAGCGTSSSRAARAEYRPLPERWPESWKRVAICLSKDPVADQVMACVRALLGDPRTQRVLIRPHPINLWHGLAEAVASLGDPRVTVQASPRLRDDLRACDLVLGGNSTVLLDALIAGTPACYVRGLDHGPHDVQDFVRDGLVYELPQLSPIDAGAIARFYSRREWPAILRRYAAVDVSPDDVARAVRFALSGSGIHHSERRMNIIAIIPARMGSSRFPGKPLAPLHGVPMLGHVYLRTQAQRQAVGRLHRDLRRRDPHVCPVHRRGVRHDVQRPHARLGSHRRSRRHHRAQVRPDRRRRHGPGRRADAGAVDDRRGRRSADRRRGPCRSST